MRLEKYKDLVFSPLSLPCPPELDAARLLHWMRWAREEGEKQGRATPEQGYRARTGRQYPWLMAVADFTQPGAIESSLGREFPEIVDYARLFPCQGIRIIALIAQQGGSDVYLHTDSDGYWGFRFYLANRNREGLYFCMAKQRVDHLPSLADDWSSYLDLTTKHYARWPAGNLPYCVNSVRAAHSVDANTSELGGRIACLVLPMRGVDEARLIDLLEASARKYGEFQLWFQPS